MSEPRPQLQLVHPSPEARLGLPALKVDLGTFLATARTVGADAGLTLLTVRALSLRSKGAVPLRELGWTLGGSEGEVRHWLRVLEIRGLCVVHETRSGSIRLEVASTETERTLFGPDDAPGVVHLVPTHWFVRTLPLLGRRAFLAYLYLRSRERAAGLTEQLTVGGVARACGFSGARQTGRALRRLTRARLIARAGTRGRFVLADPPPLTGRQRKYLAWLASGALPPTRRGRIALAVGLVVPFLLALALLLSLLSVR